jgi:hypothetical protein
MTHRRWLTAALCLLGAGTALVCAFNYVVDPFGVFRDTHGRSLSVYENERTAKYLLNEKYVPQNFDALLIGSSISANWQTSKIEGAHVYNESIDGGNAAEEQSLVEQALPTGHFKYALILISPFLTRSHQFNEGGMGRPTRREALGSINVLREEMNGLLVLTHHQPREFYPDGSKDLHTPKTSAGAFPVDAFTIDPEGLADYKQLIAELRNQNAIIIFVQPPLYQPMYESVRGYIDRYLLETGLSAPGDLMIDFNGPAYNAFRSTSANFDDGIHLSHDGAQQLSAQLNNEVQKLVRPIEGHRR